MFAFFQFNLPRAIAEHLFKDLDKLLPTRLAMGNLEALRAFQTEMRSAQGVYVLYEHLVAVYAGKSNDLAERLGQHCEKLRARRGIDMSAMAFKALVLDESWSTSANEDLLIGQFKGRGECKWNGTGFGPKDPGKERDTTKPSWFNNEYPIRDDWPVDNIPDQATVGDILRLLKDQLPFLLRYERLGKAGALPVELRGVSRDARTVLVKCAEALGTNWQLTLLKYGFILYPSIKEFKFGQRLHPLDGQPE
jgi:hypothetical protein